MATVQLALVNAQECELDKVDLTVKDKEDCSREVMAALTREKWVLSVGDRVEIRETINTPVYAFEDLRRRR